MKLEREVTSEYLEITHVYYDGSAVCYILMDRGLSMNFTDEDMNEAYAYYIGFWTRKIKKALSEIQ